ncbi:hypothetical protein LTV02_06610 [Nocardia yamanashiensis]|uniref:hypothetical protein n=1 Tax=Nocardia yamanashiensis TaxID=209247 RepID=UPI001E3B17AB|nr:hypothetical protein [Nocardia yamanashiensis]UGT43059.1 hypothetical protein LTV02_06610 [Nocardia yamanashiensis]
MVINHTNFGNFDYDDDDPVYSPPRPSKQPPQTIPVRTASTQSRGLPGSSAVAMELDRGLLPVRFQFSTNWRHHVAAHEVGRELLKAYKSAMVQHMIAFRTQPGIEPSTPFPHSHFLSPRQRLVMLLEADTWDRYSQLQSSLFGLGSYQVSGPSIDGGEPVMTVVGNREQIHSIRVWPQWWGCADPYAIEGELLDCARQVRALQPVFSSRRDWGRYTDAELSEMNDYHRRDLLENSVI